MADVEFPGLAHHGAVEGVTGSCHELRLSPESSLLIDCGLFQGAEKSQDGSSAEQLAINFPVDRVRALLVTHCHIDHVGRIPYLLAAGFAGPIYCTEPTAVLLPLVLEDAVKIGFTRDQRLLERFVGVLRKRLIAVPYKRWTSLDIPDTTGVRIRFSPAGHILGSAYVECETRTGDKTTRVLFSGDLGAPHSPLLAAPKPPYGTDILVLESTYGDQVHEGRRQRRERLREIVERCFRDRGVVLIPAFSIGRTQELLYELEEIIHRFSTQRIATEGDADLAWDAVEIIVDSPLASQFTECYRVLWRFWDAEAKRRLQRGRHPLSFEQLTTVDDHQAHLNTVAYLKKHARPCIVLAASGMCSGGRIMNYLKALIGDARSDILFVGYQADGTPGRDIQKYGPSGGYVELDGVRYPIKAGVYTLSGYSAHAGQDNLLGFVRRMRNKPREIRLVHGDSDAKITLQKLLQREFAATEVIVP